MKDAGVRSEGVAVSKRLAVLPDSNNETTQANTDKLSGAVNQFNDDKQKFKDESEFEFAKHKLILHEVRRKSTKRV